MIVKVIYKNLDALRKYSKTFNTFLEDLMIQWKFIK